VRLYLGSAYSQRDDPAFELDHLLSQLASAEQADHGDRRSVQSNRPMMRAAVCNRATAGQASGLESTTACRGGWPVS
jgi:hypothetical protein